MCDERGETVQHIICECKKLAQHKYKRRQDTVGKLVQKLYEKHNLERKGKWYKHCPEVVKEGDDVKLIWDINIQCDNVMEARKPNLILVDKKVKSYVIISVSIPGDCLGYVKKKLKRLKNIRI